MKRIEVYSFFLYSKAIVRCFENSYFKCSIISYILKASRIQYEVFKYSKFHIFKIQIFEILYIKNPNFKYSKYQYR